MKKSLIAGAIALTGALLAGAAIAQTPTPPPTSGFPENGSPGWRLAPSFPDPGGWTSTDANGVVTVLERPRPGQGAGQQQANPNARPCRGSTTCMNRNGPRRGDMMRVLWDETLGYTFHYPIQLPAGRGGVPAVAIDSQDNLWVFQRRVDGRGQLMRFNSRHRLTLTVPESVTGTHLKAHGMAVDSEDNVWIIDTTNATVKKISPDGRLLMTIGTWGQPGDWVEERGQRLLWQPVHIAFGPDGDIYIAQGHGNESPNDVDADSPTNNIGAARILQLDRNGNFIRQWFGHNVGMGKFQNAHALGVDPHTGDVWIGDREDYRIVIYNSEGQFLRTLQTRNLVCAIQFDRNGDPWMASGQDGQFLKLDRESGRVLGAIGRGMGIGEGQFIEASYWVFDRNNNLWAGDTSVSRVTFMQRPQF